MHFGALMSANRTLLEELGQYEDLSYAMSIIQSARQGTRCHELRERLAGRHAGREVTVLVPVNNAIRKAAEAKKTTVELFCRMPEVAEMIAGHAVLDRWPLAALRMLGTPLESLHSKMQLVFLPRGEKLGVKLLGSAENPARCFGDFPCRNGLLHKVQRFLMPGLQPWQGTATSGELFQLAQQSKLEMLKDRRDMQGKTWAGRPPPGPVSKAVLARRTASANDPHDRQRPQAFAPLHGHDYEPRIYTGNKPLPPRRDQSHLRAASVGRQDKTRPRQEPTLDDVWEEWEPLKREEMRLQKELEALQSYLRSKEAVVSESASFVREVLPESGLSWSAHPSKSWIEVALCSSEEHQLLQSCLAPDDPKLITSDITLGGHMVPCNSRLCSELQPWASKVWLTLELPEHLPRQEFPLWCVPRGDRGIESRIQHLESHLLLEQAAELLESEPDDRNLEAEISAKMKGDRLGDVLTWMEKRGIRWGSRDQHGFLRLCEAMDVLREPNPQSVSLQNWEQDKEHPLPNLLQQRIDKKMLAKMLNLPKLPEDHAELQALMGHLRKMASSLGSQNGQLHQMKQKVQASADSVDVLRGRLEVLESSIPCPWSIPAELWEDLMGSPVPKTAKAEALQMVSEEIAQARRKAVQKGEETAMKSEALKSSTDEKLRQVMWAEAQSASKSAEIELLKLHLAEQASHLKELERDRREGRSRANMLNLMDADEAARQAETHSLQHHAVKVQSAWRHRQAKNRRFLQAVLFLQFRVRRWRKRRQRAAQAIQNRWSSFRRLKGIKGSLESGAKRSFAALKAFTRSNAEEKDDLLCLPVNATIWQLLTFLKSMISLS